MEAIAKPTGLRETIVAKLTARSGYKWKVAAFCCHCIYDENGGGGTWRQQVEACTSLECPLYSVRPMAEKSKERGVA